MKKSIQTDKKIETGLIIRKETIFAKVKRIWNILLYKEERNFFQKIEKYLIKNKAPKNIIIPQAISQQAKGEKAMQKQQIILATNNIGKINEIKQILQDYEIIPLKETDVNIEIEEDQPTFEANAIKKAKTINQKLQGAICIADDSGIEIEYLNGFPGVQTKRWHTGTDHERNLYIIQKLQGEPKQNRKVKFITAIALAQGDEVTVVKEELNGYITTEPRGQNGFGFDEILELENGKTLAELTQDEKNEISTRKKALEKIKQQILKNNKINLKIM